MEYRKLISFGKNSYIVSLPKSWVEKNKLKKGDHIYIDEKADEISLYPKQKQKDNTVKEVMINVDGKTLSQISREINTAYITHFNSFVISGKELGPKAKEIRAVLQNLMALEIMDQTATKMVAKDFIDIENISLYELLRKMDMITRQMISDSKETLTESKYENLYIRDEDVNRIAHLVYRVAKYTFENPQVAKKLGHSAIDIMTIWRMAFTIEGIADETKRAAKYLHEIKIGKKEAEELAEIFNLVENHYLSSMKVFYNKDGKMAIGLSGTKRMLIQKCNEFLVKYGKSQKLVSAVEKIKNLLLLSNELNRIASHFYFEDKKEF